MGSIVEQDVLARAIDKALFLRLVTIDQLERLVGCTRGRADAGVAALAEALGRRVTASDSRNIFA